MDNSWSIALLYNRLGDLSCQSFMWAVVIGRNLKRGPPSAITFCWFWLKSQETSLSILGGDTSYNHLLSLTKPFIYNYTLIYQRSLWCYKNAFTSDLEAVPLLDNIVLNLKLGFLKAIWNGCRIVTMMDVSARSNIKRCLL